MQIRILLVLGILLFTQCSPKDLETSSLLVFVPENASIVLKINDFKTLATVLEQNDLLQKIQKLDASVKLSKSVSALRYVAPQQESLLSFVTDSLQVTDFIFVSNDTTTYLDLSNITDKTIETLQFEGYAITKYTVEGISFYTGTGGNKEVLSSSLNELKNLLTTLSDKTYNAKLNEFYSLSDKTKLGHLWIDLNKSDLFWQYMIHTTQNHFPSSFADWLFLDISLDNEGLSLSGISTVQEDTKNYLNLFSNTKPLANATFSMVPKDANSFSSYTFDNYRTFSANQSIYLEQKSTADSLFNTVEEFGTAFMNDQQIVLLKTYGTDELTDYLKQIRSNTIDFQGNEIWELNETRFIADRLRSHIPDFKSNYACILENTLVFAGDQGSLEQVITAFKSENTITETALFKDLQQIVTHESTLLCAANALGLEGMLERNGFNAMAKEVNAINFSDYLFGSQIVADEGFFHTSYFIKKRGGVTTNHPISPVFKIPFESNLALGPQFVLNHRTKKGELIVQDVDNVLYLLSTEGNILWKKQLESAVQGRIHQVDLFKNGNLQLAFTTGNQFLVLDRNGKTVAPFTFDFPQGNLNPLAVFDYDGKKDYRFVVTQNNSVYMYNNQGKIVNGFKYTKAGANIMETPQHFRINRKDYLVFKLADNTLKIVNRVGKERIPVKEKIAFSANPVVLFENKITVSATDGTLYQINPNGSVTKKSLGLNNDHGMDATSKTLAIINDNILSIRGKKTSLDLGVYSKPSIFYIGDKIYVSVTDIQNQKSYLFDSQSEPIPGFPIFGVSTVDMFNMDGDKKPELVIKDQENSLVVYKIN